MTESEIMKALECKSGDIICAVTDEYNNTYFVYNKNVIDLINRKNAEIERLRETTAILIPARSQGKTRFIVKKYNAVRAEAIKEFADRLKLDFGDDWGIVACGFDQLDKIAKEMGVEE